MKKSKSTEEQIINIQFLDMLAKYMLSYQLVTILLSDNLFYVNYDA